MDLFLLCVRCPEMTFVVIIHYKIQNVGVFESHINLLSNFVLLVHFNGHYEPVCGIKTVMS